jgi:NAD(P)H dehydrogenase (quinone)
MHVLIVLAHPERKSFNGQLVDRAIATLAAAGHTVELSDLYAMDFDPREHPRHYTSRACLDRFDVQLEQRAAAENRSFASDVAAELDKVWRADLLVLQYPLWWYQPPAMMKGWIDRVLAYGETYTSRLRYDCGKLKGKRAMVSVTLGGPAATYAHNGRNGDIELLLWPTQMTMHYVGMTVLQPFAPADVFGDAIDPDVQAVLGEHLDAFERHLSDIDSLPVVPFNGWSDWNDKGQLLPSAQDHSLFMRQLR